MLISLGGGAGRWYALDPVPISLVIITRFSTFLTQKVFTINIKGAFARFDCRVESSGGRGRDGEAMSLPDSPLTNLCP